VAEGQSVWLSFTKPGVSAQLGYKEILWLHVSTLSAELTTTVAKIRVAILLVRPAVLFVVQILVQRMLLVEVSTINQTVLVTRELGATDSLLA